MSTVSFLTSRAVSGISLCQLPSQAGQVATQVWDRFVQGEPLRHLEEGWNQSLIWTCQASDGLGLNSAPEILENSWVKGAGILAAAGLGVAALGGAGAVAFRMLKYGDSFFGAVNTVADSIRTTSNQAKLRILSQQFRMASDAEAQVKLAALTAQGEAAIPVLANLVRIYAATSKERLDMVATTLLDLIQLRVTSKVLKQKGPAVQALRTLFQKTEEHEFLQRAADLLVKFDPQAADFFADELICLEASDVQIEVADKTYFKIITDTFLMKTAQPVQARLFVDQLAKIVTQNWHPNLSKKALSVMGALVIQYNQWRCGCDVFHELDQKLKPTTLTRQYLENTVVGVARALSARVDVTQGNAITVDDIRAVTGWLIKLACETADLEQCDQYLELIISLGDVGVVALQQYQQGLSASLGPWKLISDGGAVKLEYKEGEKNFAYGQLFGTSKGDVLDAMEKALRQARRSGPIKPRT